ncbi:MAG: hypothetical protein EP323_00410 [Gammaproteobacteria bacterium]|nr:MAG: hypothetical protein EP323_00410 [Gammaproteobacteria bacterium]
MRFKTSKAAKEGGFFMSDLHRFEKGKGGGGSTTVQKADPWKGQQSYLTDTFNEAQNIYKSGGPNFYNQATYTPFSPQSEMAMQLTQDRAMNGSPLNYGAQDLAFNTMRGDYLNNNPYLDQMFQQGADKIAGNVNAQFSNAGRTGSDSHAGVLADSMGDLYNNMYGQNYANERQNQMNAMQLAPGLANTDYADFEKLGQVGQMVEGKAGQVLQDNINRFDFYQNRPEDALAKYVAAIQGNYGGSSVSSTDTQTSSNPLAGAIGGGLVANGLGASLSGAGLAGPWGIAGGALLGGLLG